MRCSGLNPNTRFVPNEAAGFLIGLGALVLLAATLGVLSARWFLAATDGSRKDAP